MDLDNPDNFGLDVPIAALAPIVDLYNDDEDEDESEGLSRADIWVLAGLEAAKQALKLRVVPDFDAGTTVFPEDDGTEEYRMDFIGRKDCDAVGGIGGPPQSFPQANWGTHDVVDYFAEVFDFSPQETVAILGAHDMGFCNRGNSGFDGRWSANAFFLTNQYFNGLAFLNWDQLDDGFPHNAQWETRFPLDPDGDHTPWDPIYGSQLFQALPFLATFAGNAFPSTFNAQTNPLNPITAFTAGVQPPGPVAAPGNGMMLNADLSLVRDFSDDIGSDGRLTCSPDPTDDLVHVPIGPSSNILKHPSTACPYATQTVDFVRAYAQDLALFRHDFQLSFQKMLNTVPSDVSLVSVDYDDLED